MTKWWFWLVALVAFGMKAQSGSAATAGWRAAGAIDSAPVVALSCPSAALCVAVDSAGGVLVSSAPTVAASWQRSVVDPGSVFSGLSCPVSTLCVAVDSAGDVVTSSDPAGGAATWTSTNVDAGQSLSGVSCASTTLCAAIGAFVLVSSNPGGGAAAWTDTGVGRGTYYETSHYGGSPDAPPTGISCVESPIMCVVVDDAGGSAMSLDPTGPASTWTRGPDSGEDLALSCVAGGPCVTTCPESVVAGSSNCPGEDYEAGAIVTWNPLTPYSLPTGTTVAPDNITQIWCQSRALCFATDGTAAPGLFSSANGAGYGHLYASTNPTGPASAWWTPYTDHAGIIGVSCPAATCIAVDRAGELLLGYRPPTSTQIANASRATLRRVRATINRLGAHHRDSVTLNAVAPGHVTITLTAHPVRAKTVVLAKSSVTVRKLGATKLSIRPTRAGKTVLASGKRLTITATISFALQGASTFTTRTTFRLHPH